MYPCFLLVSLHWLSPAAVARYLPPGLLFSSVAKASPILIRYADDLVVLCHSREQAEQAKAWLAAWLAPRGLAFNEDKTNIVTVEDGFDFLGFNIRRYGASC